MKIYVTADHIISPLGLDTDENVRAVMSGKTGIRTVDEQNIYPEPFCAALIDRQNVSGLLDFKGSESYTFLEKLFIFSIGKVLERVGDFDRSRTILILSTTKGNIDLLDKNCVSEIPVQRVEIPTMARAVNDYFGFPHAPLVVSNACISGVSAMLTAKKLIESGMYDHAIVSGGDIITVFVVSGFHAFKAISEVPCKPYDANRTGITLGEGCGTVFISADPGLAREGAVVTEIIGGGQSNDANHISGPSRTGSGLILAVQKTLKSADIAKDDIDFIGAHGTATSYNDEMEAVAFNTLAMQNIPLNSLKGYFGHTLGGAGLIESICTYHQLQAGEIAGTLGLETLGVTQPLTVFRNNIKSKKAVLALKTISGFGGCNAGIIFKKA